VDLLPASRADREGLAVLAAMRADPEDLEEAQAGLVADPVDQADLARRPSR
jgi:hypothetical protein